MVKPRGPKGHIWTHASAFQQSTKYCDVRFEECTAPASKVLVEDSDDDLPRIERNAKRRRIEKLANDFLNGIPLLISSARPSPRSLQSAVVRNQKKLNPPQSSLISPHDSTAYNDSSATWADMEDEDEVLERLNRRHQVEHISAAAVDISHSNDATEVVRMQALKAQANCRPAQRMRSLRPTTNPSEEALQQAAELRARRGLRATSEVPIASKSPTDPAPTTGSVPEPRSEPRGKLHKLADADVSDKWLSRRRSRLVFTQYAADDASQDELRLSNIQTPSNPSGDLRVDYRHRATDAPQKVPPASPIRYQDPNGLVQGSQERLRGALVGTAQVELPNPSNGSVSSGSSPQKVSYHTASEGNRSETEALGLATANEGDKIYKASRSLVHPPSPNRTAAQDLIESRISKPAQLEWAGPTPNHVCHSSPASRRTRSATSSQSVSDDSGPPSAYTKVLASQNGSTPFMFRKRHSTNHNSDQKPKVTPAPKEKQNSSRHLSDNTKQLDHRRHSEKSKHEKVPAEGPAPHTSLDPKSHHSEKPNEDREDDPHGDTSIVEGDSTLRLDHGEYSPQNGARKTNLEPAKRTNLSSPSSQAVEAQGQSATEQRSAQSQVWAGTQFLLDKAQRDLFVSPEKPGAEDSNAEQYTPQPNEAAEKRRPLSKGRETLAQMSQEPLPSTQQLLCDFQGWSTVKKPWYGISHSQLPTPTAKGRTSRFGSDQTTLVRVSSSAPKASHVSGEAEKIRAGSSLSTSSTELPRAMAMSGENLLRVSSSNGQPSQMRLSRPTAIRSSNSPTTTSEMFQVSKTGEVSSAYNSTFDGGNSDAPFTSFQAAQNSSLHRRESFDLSETVDDLRDLLDLSEMGGVLSQV